MEVDLDEEKPFKVLPWNISASAAPKGMRVVEFDGDYALIVWFEDYAFVRKDVKADGSKIPCGPPEDLVKLSGVKILDVFQLDGKVYILDVNGDLAYLRKRTRTSGNTNGFGLTFFEKIRAGARNILAIPDGFIILLVIAGHWYLNLYKIVDDGLELMQSLKLGSLPVEGLNCSCVVSSCYETDLDPALMEALFPNGNPKKGFVFFVGFPTGETFYFHVQISTSQCADIAATMLYVSPEAVVGISMFKDPSTKKYSHIILVQRSGALVTMSGHEKVLMYGALYLPSSVDCIALPRTNVLWSSDGIGMWLNRVVRHERGDLLLQSSCVPVGNVHFVSCLEPGQDEAIALTNENTLFYVRLTQESGNAACKMLPNYAARQQEIIEKSEELAKILQEIAKEDLEIDAINFARRAELLRDKFNLTVKVYDMVSHSEQIYLTASLNSSPFNESGDYVVEGTIENSSGQEISSSVWSLQVTFKVGDVGKLRKVGLNATFGRNPFKFKLPLQVLDPCAKVYVQCHLIAEVNLGTDSERLSNWVILPVGSAVMDASYFFRAMISGRHKIDRKYIPCKAHKMQDNLQKIADEHGVGGDARLLMENPRTYQMNTQIECTYVLSLPENSKHQSVWLSVTRNCFHRCEKTFRLRIKPTDSSDIPNGGLENISAVDILIERKVVKLTLDPDCTKLEIRCCDVEMLHAVKLSLISLLHVSDVVNVGTSLQKQVQEFKTEFELEQNETPNVAALRKKWRGITSQLPL